MISTELKLKENGKGEIVLLDRGEKIGYMIFHTEGARLMATDTVVDSKYRGQGLGKYLMEAMRIHAETENLKIVPVCPYVKLQMERQPDVYAAIVAEEEE